MVKRCSFSVVILAVLSAVFLLGACGGQKVRCVTGIKNGDHYYLLEFEKMNREDSCIIPAGKGDVFSVHCRIDQGHTDLVIAVDEKTPIYKGNDIESGDFDVIVPEDGEYRITISAKRASGCIEVYGKKGDLSDESKL